MDNFTFYSPTYFDFGKDSELHAPQLIKQFGGSRILLHYGGGSIKKSGLYDRVTDSLKKAGLFYLELAGVKPNPRSGLVYEGIELCKREKVDFILAIGGGSTIDSAKAIAAGSVYDGDFMDFYQGKATIEKALPVGTILTIAAAGSEGSPNTVITHEETQVKKGTKSDFLRPRFSILNPELTCTLPAYQTAAGATDIMIHVCERYFSNTKEVEITDRLCEAILKTIIYETPRVLKNPDNYEARANIMWAGMLAHNNVCGVGREQDWASHHIEHELSALYDVTHGAGLAVIAPLWMRHVLDKNPDKLVSFAVRVWNIDYNMENPKETALKGIEAFESFLKNIGMPSSFDEIGAKKEDITHMADKLMGSKTTEGNYVKLSKEDVIKIYESAVK
ncbi:MAG: iron-containing alcohol dehydrogenase [Lachnospiraceae bacterium]|nr:iron-containing alcohol dehydrogenase [Lachnospiraceae bacterium]